MQTQPTQKIAPRWNDKERASQKARLSNLNWQYNEVESIAQEIRKQLKDKAANQDPEERRANPIPSRHVIQSILAFFRTCNTLTDPIETLELANHEIAKLLGLGMDALKRCLRYLRELGYVERERRYGPAEVGGQIVPRNRTALTSLTLIGRGLLGLIRPNKDQATKTSFSQHYKQKRDAKRKTKESKRSAQARETEDKEAEAARDAEALQWQKENNLDSAAGVLALIKKTLGIRSD